MRMMLGRAAPPPPPPFPQAGIRVDASRSQANRFMTYIHPAPSTPSANPLIPRRKQFFPFPCWYWSGPVKYPHDGTWGGRVGTSRGGGHGSSPLLEALPRGTGRPEGLSPGGHVRPPR